MKNEIVPLKYFKRRNVLLVTLIYLIHFRGEPALRNRCGYDPSKDSDDIAGAFKNHWMYGQGSDEVLPDANRHEQEDGSIIAVAATGMKHIHRYVLRLLSGIFLSPLVPLLLCYICFRYVEP